MYIQPNCSIIVGSNFQTKGKRLPFKICLSFLLVFILCIAQHAAARPNQDEDLARDEFRDADNLEAHSPQVIDIESEENHPVIIYKEDFVNYDYVPPKNETKSEKHKRRYKDIAHRRRHIKLNLTDVVIEDKPEKILFDIIPEHPLIVPEDMEKHRKSHIKLVPLTDDFVEVNETYNEENALKKELQKKPTKKYHHRVRRSTNAEHIVRKRNPYFRHIPKVTGEVTPPQVQYIYVKHSVPGKKHNGLDIPVPGPQLNPTADPDVNIPISFENRVAADENDRVIFSGGKVTSRPSQRVTTESIFRDPRPENFDFSFMNSPPATTTTRTPIFTRRPQVVRQEESIFRDPRPENFDFSFMNPQQQQSSFSSVRSPAPTSSIKTESPKRVSQCVWAIVNCCLGTTSEIRYACFEQNGCYSAFWGLNPCAENHRDSLVNFVADYYN